MKILMIVPGFGKNENALFDYARIIGAEFEKLGNKVFFDLNNYKEADVIFLNYSGYGYQKRGIPFQLYFWLRNKVQQKKIPLFVFFHELYAKSNKPWQSSFWLSLFQKWIYLKLYKLSVYCFSSNQFSMNEIKEQSSDNGAKVIYTGLISNVPEIEKLTVFEKRDDIAIVFGTFCNRKKVYDRHEQVNNVCAKLGVKKIIDIGEGNIGDCLKKIIVTVEVKGLLPLNDVGQFLSTAKLGFINYENHRLGKSGVFAAYAAHGIVAVNFYKATSESFDGLIEQKHYLQSNEYSIMQKNSGELSIISNYIFEWYHSHDLNKHFKTIQSIIYKAFL